MFTIPVNTFLESPQVIKIKGSILIRKPELILRRPPGRRLLCVDSDSEQEETLKS